MQADNIAVLVAFLSEESTPTNSPCKASSSSATNTTVEDVLIEPPRTPKVPLSPPPTTDQLSLSSETTPPGPSNASSSRSSPRKAVLTRPSLDQVLRSDSILVFTCPNWTIQRN